MPNLVAVVTFNPPVVKLMGSTLREETVQKLQQRLPTSTSTQLSSRRAAPTFELKKDPEHWSIDLGQSFCDQLGRSLIFMDLIEILEAEEWKLKGTNCVVHPDSGKDTTKFFFYRA
eukprot:GILI01001654.1.p1 GENE.GILI01001654.1~~GILI01001654.1.p1  ORF type:complete len:116 (+),score=40.12 GILI01001654.1:73-420(+)